jgi:hypothetical protein
LRRTILPNFLSDFSSLADVGGITEVSRPVGAQSHDYLGKFSCLESTAEGASDFCCVLQGFDRSIILSQMYRLSGHVRHDELLDHESARKRPTRRMILLDSLVGLFRSSRRHRNYLRYLAKLTLSQMVTRKGLAQEIRLLGPRQAFRRYFSLQSFDCLSDFCRWHRLGMHICLSESLDQKWTGIGTARYRCSPAFNHPICIGSTPQ